MTEYWVSKKQYFCKYCSIYIRDDAPSRKQHETGLKHVGNVERYIRDLYKGGAQAKREKEAEALEMARIEAAAAAAHANDTASGASTSKLSVLQTLAASSLAKRPVRDKPKDKFSNYSTAEQLGFVDPEAVAEAEPEEVSYEIAQKLGGQAAQIGKWEVVDESKPSASTGVGVLGEKRAWDQREDEENQGWKFDHKGKKAVHDPYEDDWDPSSLKLKVKKTEERIVEDRSARKQEGGLKREGWTGKLELNPASSKKDGLQYVDGGWVKIEEGVETAVHSADGAEKEGDVKPDVEQDKTKSVAPADTKPVAEAESAGGSSMFKKRRPPPSSRKK